VAEPRRRVGCRSARLLPVPPAACSSALHVGERVGPGTPRLCDTSAGRLSPAPAQLVADPVFQSDRRCYRLPLTLPLNRPQTRWHGFARVARICTVWPAHASTEIHWLQRVGRFGPLSQGENTGSNPVRAASEKSQVSVHFRCAYHRIGGGACHSLCHSIGRDSMRLQHHLGMCSTRCPGAMPLAELVMVPWTDRNTSRMWCQVNLLESLRRPSSRWEWLSPARRCENR
jgi:hypothetical protein